jgi:small subunit ribosomal protein S11
MAEETTPEEKPEQAAPPPAEKKPAAEAVPEAPAAAPAMSEAQAMLAPDAPKVGEEDAKPAPRRRSRSGKHVPVGIVFVKATFNNTIVSITDMKGDVVSWGSAGRSGFKGSRKSTAFAATVVAQDAARQAVGFGMQEVEVRVQGPGAGRESAIRALQSSGLTVTSIKDVTAVPHNGCRPPKRRRV